MENAIDNRVGVSRRPSRKGGLGATQISLPGFAPVPERNDRLFFAVLPDIETAGQIAQLASCLRSERGLHGKPLDAARLHVSLQGLGDHSGVPQALVALVSEAASTVVLPSFVARFDRVLSFSGKLHTGKEKRAVVLAGGSGIAGLLGLHRALLAALQGLGIAASSFTPHITLLYEEQHVAERGIEAVSWTVREFVLIHSRIGQKLPYALLGRWPLHN
jgi:RNA 2',3'-cyclic 3'-phosphodiesterase